MRVAVFASSLTSPAHLHAADIPFSLTVIDAQSPANPWGKEVGDIDGDTRPDVVVAGSAGPLVWYQAPPTGSTWARHTIASSGYVTESGLALGDIDSDGDLDVVLGYLWYENPRPSGNPATSSWPPHAIDGAFSGSNHDIVAADLDNDGKLDVVMRGEGGPRVYVFKQVTPTSWSRKDLDPGVGNNGLAVADVDGDGWKDVIVGGRWFKNPNGDIVSGTWEVFSFASWSAWAGVETVDFNGDGRRDIVLSVSESVGPLAWFENPANPTGVTAWTEHPIASALTNVHRVAVADMDKDGTQDVVAAEFAGAGRLIVYKNGGGGLGWTAQTPGSPSLHNIKAVDVGNDNDVDIVGSETFGVGKVELWENGLGGAPTLTIDDVTVAEGNTGTATARFTVTLAPPSSATVSVSYATADGTAQAPADYLARNGTLIFPPNTATQPVSVTVNADGATEGVETFFVALSNASGAQVGRAQGTGRIFDPSKFFTLAPCRLVDTRLPSGPRGGPALVPGPTRGFTLSAACGVPSSAQAVAVNVAVTQPTSAGHLRISPGGGAMPLTSSINYSAGQTRANNAVVSLGTAGDIEVGCYQAGGSAHFILDVSGYYE